MLVDRYQIKLPRPESSATTINVPIDLTPQLVDQAEIIDRKFVEVEVENAINPILDYEKVRFLPAKISPTPTATTVNSVIQIQTVTYQINLFDANNNAYFSSTTYAEAGFDNDDLRFRKNRLIKSFLRLDFYDSDILTDQRLVATMSINPNITYADIQPNISAYPVAQNKQLWFELKNPLTNDEVFGEGFFIYYFKDEVDINLPENLYMRATFSNAKTGVSKGLMTDQTQVPIDDLVDQLHTRYVLHRTETGYFYAIDNQYSNNVIVQLFPNQNATVQLYEVRVS
jgi:hypothetical protein